MNKQDIYLNQYKFKNSVILQIKQLWKQTKKTNSINRELRNYSMETNLVS